MKNGTNGYGDLWDPVSMFIIQYTFRLLTQYYIYLLQLDSHEIESTIKDTMGIMQENSAMIKEVNRESAQLMEHAVAVVKSIAPTSRK